MAGWSELPRTRAALDAGVAAGDHVGAQVYVSRRGAPIADVALGDARPGVPMTPDTIMCWLSSGKPLTAVAVAQCWERGRLALDDAVAAHIPEFGTHGKEAITIRHLLTHTGGFRLVDFGTADTPTAETLSRIWRARPEPRWVPGRKAGYHAATSWFVLGELVHRLDGRPIDRVVRADVCEPAGMVDAWLALPPARYAAYGARIGDMQDTSKTPPGSKRIDTPARAAWVMPPGNARGPAHDLGRFYESLLGFGPPLLRPQTVEAMTARHRVGMLDRTFGHVIDWGLGFVLDSKHTGDDAIPYQFGPHASWRTYGHAGAESSIGFADPEHGLAVAIVCNGMPGAERHERRMRALTAALYADLALA